MRTGKLSKLSAEHEVKYTGNESFFVITMLKTSGIVGVLYRLVVRESGSKIRQGFSSAKSRK